MIAFSVTASVYCIMLAFATWFRGRQNTCGADGKSPTGGAISWPKALWLAYAIGAWYLIPFAFILDGSVSERLKILVIAHTGVWWVRGPLELVMIYKWFNWTPLYGISHDLIHAALLAVGLGWWAQHESWSQLSDVGRVALVYLALTVVTTLVEASFAYLFRKARQHDLIYFADDSPRFRFINRYTTCTVIVVYTHLTWQLVALWRAAS